MVPVDALEVKNICLLDNHHVISFVSENQSFNLFLIKKVCFGNVFEVWKASGEKRLKNGWVLGESWIEWRFTSTWRYLRIDNRHQ